MEMTSSEIIHRLTQANDATGLNELKSLFETADLVKFAKHSALINENDMNLVNAIDFINSTKIENMPTEEIVKPQLSENEEKQQVARRVLTTSIFALSAITFALIVYVVYLVYGSTS
jgi:hypothetical protein